MPSPNPYPLANGGWGAHAPKGLRKLFSTYEDAVAWINANGAKVVTTEDTRRFI